MRAHRLVLIFFILPSCLYAQKELGRRPFISDLEFFGGMNVSLPTGNSFLDNNGQLNYGYIIGAGIVHDFNNRFSIASVIQWERKGTKTSYQYLNESLSPPEIETVDQRVNFYYLTVAVIPKVKVLQNPAVSFGMGPYVSYLQSAEGESVITRGSTPISYFHSSDSRADRKEFDFGILMLLQAQFPISDKIGGIVICTTGLGITDVSNPDLPLLPVKNTCISLMLGLTLIR